ncbi:MAG: PQQ-dependent sugar dehydrogenase [Phycisphaerales bacterium]|nr:PQQ-dependent sugar dehydrogenase [Phycisphaerales bacterium]
MLQRILAVVVRSATAAVALTVALVAQTPLKLQTVASGLVRPTFMASPPGDAQRLFVAEQPGRIRIVKNGALLPTPFLDLAAMGVVSFGGELGLLGFAFHPSFASNGQVFVSHSGFPFPTAIVRRFTVSATNPDVADPASGFVVLSQPMLYGNHNGGMVAFGPDGYLYIGLGDGGSTAPSWPDDPLNHAQRGDSLLGKLLRLDVDNPQPPLPYGIPASNPFAGPGLPRDEIWALGLRNPWRFGFDRATGDLWLADVGGMREEVDFVAAGDVGGRNFGWSCMAGTYCNATSVCACYAPSLTPPFHEYTIATSSRAIIGGYVYRGAAIPDLVGSYFFADFNSRQLWSLRRVQGGVAQLQSRTAELVAPAPATLAGVLSFGEDAAGELHLGDMAGNVYRIVPDGPLVAGVSPFGLGTPGCSGVHALFAPTTPRLGTTAFGLRATAGAPGGLGAMAFAAAADAVGTDVGLGCRVHLSLLSPLLLLQSMVADAQGIGGVAFAIPAAPALVGYTLHAQALWLWSPAACAAVSGGFSSSNGVTIVLQP